MYQDLRQAKPQGFTLIELLVGLTLMALISVILFSGMRFGVRAWDTGGERIERVARVELVQNLLRRQLSQASLAPSGGGKPVAALVGQSDRVTFIAPPPKQGEGEDDFVFVLAKRDESQGSHLVLTWTFLRPPASTETGRNRELTTRLIENIASIEFAYYGAPDPNRPAQWWDNWAGGALPILVRLRLTFPKGDLRRWPDLIIRVVRASG